MGELRKASQRKDHWNDLKKVRTQVKCVSEKEKGWRAAWAKALRWACTWCVQGIAQREGKEGKSSRRVEK